MKKILSGLWTTACLFILSLPFAAAQETDERPQLPGQIAYVGTDFNIYNLNLSDYSSEQLTTDASETRRYQWPTWSTDGRLAYFSLSLEDGELLTGAYVSADGHDAGDLVYTGPEYFNYAYWSPGNCEAAANCRDLAVLLSSQTRGMFVELIRDGLEEERSLTAGLGGPPFYYSWSPDGGRMLWQRNNQRFDIYDANEDRVTDTLKQTPGFILAPAWSPVDDRLLFGARGVNNTTDLVIIGDDSVITLAEGLDGLVSFSWSPDGNLVAYREQTAQGFGSLIVVDAVTAETVVRSPDNGIISFFWSPDSQQIAYLTLASLPGSFNAGSSRIVAQPDQPPIGIAWSILDVDSEEVRQYGAFLPTQETIYLMQYFDQFAQSHRIWSPDSKHLLYSELTRSGPVINLLDTSQVGSVPFSIAEGVIGVWSFQ
jgi:TolB protein